MFQSDTFQAIEGGEYPVGTDRAGRTFCLFEQEMRSGLLVLGGNDTPRSEVLLGLAANMMKEGAGLVYIDCSRHGRLAERLELLATRMGRESDFRVLNFMNGGRVVRTETWNPFASGPSHKLVQLCIELMDDLGPDDDHRRERAVAMLSGVGAALVWKRDHEDLALDIGVIRDNIGLDAIEALSRDETLPPSIKGRLRSYLSLIPGYDPSKAAQCQHTKEQHGYLQMLLGWAMHGLCDYWGYIFATGTSSLDMADVVANNRILVVEAPDMRLLPLDGPPLAKVVLASVKYEISELLRSGRVRSGNDAANGMSLEVPTGERRPLTPIILDDVGQYLVPGLDVLASTAGELGFSLVFADRDRRSMMHSNEKVGAAMLVERNAALELSACGEENLVLLRHDQRQPLKAILPRF
jgi:intracellular multiplication protein IcmO